MWAASGLSHTTRGDTPLVQRPERRHPLRVALTLGSITRQRGLVVVVRGHLHDALGLLMDALEQRQVPQGYRRTWPDGMVKP